ncbi:MAG: antibiotic biosynthesis monooxygenase [Candidatus Korobacteraceae bacterium]
MFTRVVELLCKPGKTAELTRTASEKILPILRKQQGFQDEIVLTSNTDPSRVMALSFWTRREDAERYQREQYQQIAEMLLPFCEERPIIATFDVNASTVHHIEFGKAA